MEKQLWQIMLIRLKEISINIQKNEEQSLIYMHQRELMLRIGSLSAIGSIRGIR